MANIKEIETKVIDTVCEQLSIERDKVKLESSFIEDLGADSLDVVELVMIMEESFKIEIKDSDAEKMKTVGDVVKYISNK